MHQDEELKADYWQAFQCDTKKRRLCEVGEHDEIDGKSLEERDELRSDAFQLVNQKRQAEKQSDKMTDDVIKARMLSIESATCCSGGERQV